MAYYWLILGSGEGRKVLHEMTPSRSQSQVQSTYLMQILENFIEFEFPLGDQAGQYELRLS